MMNPKVRASARLGCDTVLAYIDQSGKRIPDASDEAFLYEQLTSLTALVAFPSSTLPIDLASAVAAAAEAARVRIGSLFPRYCGFEIGEVVKVASIADAAIKARIEALCINEIGTASILLQPIRVDGKLAAPVQFPLHYARQGLASLSLV
jgi:hypothetical protein